MYNLMQEWMNRFGGELRGKYVQNLAEFEDVDPETTDRLFGEYKQIYFIIRELSTIVDGEHVEISGWGCGIFWRTYGAYKSFEGSHSGGAVKTVWDILPQTCVSIL